MKLHNILSALKLHYIILISLTIINNIIVVSSILNLFRSYYTHSIWYHAIDNTSKLMWEYQYPQGGTETRRRVAKQTLFTERQLFNLVYDSAVQC